MHVIRLEQGSYIKINVLQRRNDRECYSKLVEAVENCCKVSHVSESIAILM
jgi:hypothetical protein